MWIILEILFLLLEFFYLWRFYVVVVLALLTVWLGDWLLPPGSGVRDLGWPFVVVAAISGLIWEIRVSRRENYSPKITTLADKDHER